MKTTKEIIEIMNAYDNGAEIEIFMNDEWKDAISPGWNWNHCDYRIKEQKTTITIEKWLVSYEDNMYQILTGNRDFFNKNIHPQAKVKLLESYEVEL